MKTYRICTLDVDDTNEINDMHSTSDTIELTDEPTISEVCIALKCVLRMAWSWPESEITLEEDGENYFVCNREGHKGYFLMKEG